MNIYFVAGFDLILEFKNEKISVKQKEIIKCSNLFDGEIIIRPENDNCELMSYTIDCNKILVGKNSKFEVFNLNNNDKLIFLKPFVYYNPLNLECKNITACGTNFLINIYNQNYGLAQIIYNSNCINFVFNDINFTCEEFIKKIDNKEFLFIKLSQLNESDFYYIFNQENLVFEGKIKDINITNSKIIILKNDITCYGQKNVVEYNVKDKKSEEYLVYYDSRNICKKIDIKYLFVDAIKIKNYELLKDYLSSDLKDLPEENFWLFFGLFDDYLFIENNCILYHNNQIVKIVKIEIKNNTIFNLSD